MGAVVRLGPSADVRGHPVAKDAQVHPRFKFRTQMRLLGSSVFHIGSLFTFVRLSVRPRTENVKEKG